MELPPAGGQRPGEILPAAGSPGGGWADDLHEPGPSRDHTERMLRAMGVQREQSQTCSRVSDKLALYLTGSGPAGGLHCRR